MNSVGRIKDLGIMNGSESLKTLTAELSLWLRFLKAFDFTRTDLFYGHLTTCSTEYIHAA